jgi:hypothetical protein
MRIDLTKRFDPTSMISGQPCFEPSKEKIVQGVKETIEVGKTKYECDVVTITRTYTNPKNNAESTFEFKVWTSGDAPLGGVVKLEMKYNGANGEAEQVAMILEESGKR